MQCRCVVHGQLYVHGDFHLLKVPDSVIQTKTNNFKTGWTVNQAVLTRIAHAVPWILDVKSFLLVHFKTRQRATQS